MNFMKIWIIIGIMQMCNINAQVVEHLKPGIYVEDLGEIHKIEDKMDVCYDIDLTTSIKNLQKLETIKEITLRQCNRPFLQGTQRNCATIESIMQARINRINMHLSSFTPRRDKRSFPWNTLAGAVISYATGTFNSEDKTRVARKENTTDEKIKSIEDSIIKLGDLVAKNAEQFSAELKGCLSNNTIFEKIQVNFNKLERIEDLIEKQIYQDQIISEMTFAFELLSEKQLRFLENVRDTLDDLANDIFTTKLMTMNEIRDDIMRIKLDNMNRMLPFQGKMSHEEFRKLCRFGVYHTSYGYKIVFVIPIISTERLLIHRALAIPTIKDKMAIAKKIQDLLIITDQSLTKQSLIEKEKLAGLCVQMGRQYFCETTFTWSKQKTCELAAVNGQELMIERDCETIAYRMQNSLFIRTQNKNKLIVLCDHPKKAKFVGKSAINLQLDTTNLIYIDQPGTLFIDEFELDFSKQEHYKLTEVIQEEPINVKLQDFDTVYQKDLIPIVTQHITDQKTINEMATTWKDYTQAIETEKSEENLKILTVIIIIMISTAITIAGICSLMCNDQEEQPEEDPEQEENPDNMEEDETEQ